MPAPEKPSESFEDRITNAIMRAIREAARNADEGCSDLMCRAAARAALHVCWREVGRYIVTGDIGGNGWDQTAQRNGLILASNILAPWHADRPCDTE